MFGPVLQRTTSGATTANDEHNGLLPSCPHLNEVNGSVLVDEFADADRAECHCSDRFGMIPMGRSARGSNIDPHALGPLVPSRVVKRHLVPVPLDRADGPVAHEES